MVIGRSGAGYDKIDVAACTEHGVALFNVPLALNHPTASAALLLMLALVKRLPQQEKVARAGQWERQREVMGGELQGRMLGIIGLGHSGREARLGLVRNPVDRLIDAAEDFDIRLFPHREGE